MELAEHREERTKYELHRSDLKSCFSSAEVALIPTENKREIPNRKGLSSFCSLSSSVSAIKNTKHLEILRHSTVFQTEEDLNWEHCGYWKAQDPYPQDHPQ